MRIETSRSKTRILNTNRENHKRKINMKPIAIGKIMGEAMQIIIKIRGIIEILIGTF
jgi:hypothetical protein